MRAPVSASSWWKRTSYERVADTRRTGTVTNPKLMDPVQMAVGKAVSPFSWPTTFAGRGTCFQQGAQTDRRARAHGPRRDRRPPVAGDEPRQGLVPGQRVHQRSGRRLL